MAQLTNSTRFWAWRARCATTRKPRIGWNCCSATPSSWAAELATPADKRDKLKETVTPAVTARLDAIVAEIEQMPGLLGDWALPGASGGGAAIDGARAVARRAERCVVRLRGADAGLVSDEMLAYLNRLSDVIWLLGRRYEMRRGVDGALRV